MCATKCPSILRILECLSPPKDSRDISVLGHVMCVPNRSRLRACMTWQWSCLLQLTVTNYNHACGGAGVGHVVRAIERSIILYRDHAWTKNKKSPSLKTKASFHGIASKIEVPHTLAKARVQPCTLATYVDALGKCNFGCFE